MNSLRKTIFDKINIYDWKSWKPLYSVDYTVRLHIMHSLESIVENRTRNNTSVIVIEKIINESN